MYYDVLGIIFHFGGATGGHYITWALDQVNQQWIEYDDQWVRPKSKMVKRSHPQDQTPGIVTTYLARRITS